jgi:hypothetical protein
VQAVTEVVTPVVEESQDLDCLAVLREALRAIGRGLLAHRGFELIEAAHQNIPAVADLVSRVADDEAEGAEIVANALGRRKS